jgi:aspartate kinase
MIVMKFGGTSLESAEALQAMISIVQQRLDQKPVVVVSALGKTTNRLIELARSAAAGDQTYAARLNELRRYHWDTAIQLIRSQHFEELGGFLEQHFQELSQILGGLAVLGELTPRSLDAVSSYGERLSSRIVCMALYCAGVPTVHVDARDMIVTDARHTQAAPDLKETYSRLKKHVKRVTERRVPVMGGFIASTATGVTTTLGRGGSDYTAAIVGAGIGAQEIQIWTDVDGMLTTDPRIVPEARRLRTISFSEAAELAYFGAKVLHPYTVRPAMDKNVPVVILNSRKPAVEGTRVISSQVKTSNVVKAIACKRGIVLVNIHSAKMLMAHGFLKRVFEVFEKWETPVDVVATSEVSVSLTIDDANALASLRQDLEQFAEVSVEIKRAIISLVGEGLRDTAGVAARVFSALQDVNVRMISQGASLLNLSLVVADGDLERAVKALHDEFFSEVDMEVFG